jgi:tagaturonate reductase
MHLSLATISKIGKEKDDVCYEQIFSLPEKVLQFGTGVLLRGLPDYFINKANQRGIFNGRIVAVKSTSQGDVDVFNKQDCLYTLCVNGIKDGKIVEETTINSSISRVLLANSNWNEILKCAENPQMEIVISNTTEVGIQLTNDDIHTFPPLSFPGKLLSFLHKRYTYFKGDSSKGMVIIPTELIPDNGTKLLSVLIELSLQNKLEDSFKEWLINDNHFCNSLVDRIVPGKLPPEKQKQRELLLGYKDELLITAEPYRLWAIEIKNDEVKQLLSFSECDEGVVLSPDINLYRELKLHLLNGTHTFCCGLAYLAGFNTVKEAMANEVFSLFVNTLIKEEIVPAICGNSITATMAYEFAEEVLDRFRNPYIEHQWLNVCQNYTLKMKTRNIATIKNYFNKNKNIPVCMALGMAAFILFMKAEQRDKRFYGKTNNKGYEIQDSNLPLIYEKWQNSSTTEVVRTILSDTNIWETDLTELAGFEKAVQENLNELTQNNALQAINTTLGKLIT